MAYCTRCGAKLGEKSVCPVCGAAQEPWEEEKKDVVTDAGAEENPEPEAAETVLLSAADEEETNVEEAKAEAFAASVPEVTGKKEQSAAPDTAVAGSAAGTVAANPTAGTAAGSENRVQSRPAHSEERLIKPWGYIGYRILLSIPLVGLILAIVWSFDRNYRNRRNFARSYFCEMLIGLILLAIVMLGIVVAVLLIGNAASWMEFLHRFG